MKRFLKWSAISIALLLILFIALGVVFGGKGKPQESAELPGVQHTELPPRNTATTAPTPTLRPTVTPSLRAIPFDELEAKAARITYDDLFRNNERYIGSLVYYRAFLVQVIPVKGDQYQIRAGVSLAGPECIDTVLLNYAGSRLLENDDVELVGKVKGLITYKSVLGGPITVPLIDVIQVHVLLKASEGSGCRYNR